MISAIKNQQFGFLAIAILLAGFVGLLLPIAFQWNRWILLFALVHKAILIPVAFAIGGLWYDRPKYASIVALLLAVALYLAPKGLILVRTIR